MDFSFFEHSFFPAYQKRTGKQGTLPSPGPFFCCYCSLSVIGYFYFLISRDSPVISLGFSIPIISIRVGTISARRPPSLRV